MHSSDTYSDKFLHRHRRDAMETSEQKETSKINWPTWAGRHYHPEWKHTHKYTHANFTLCLQQMHMQYKWTIVLCIIKIWLSLKVELHCSACVCAFGLVFRLLWVCLNMTTVVDRFRFIERECFYRVCKCVCLSVWCWSMLSSCSRYICVSHSRQFLHYF